MKSFIFATVLFLLSGCCGPQTAKINSYEDVGSTYITVVSDIPWEEIAEDLQPQFVFDEETAKREALPVTMRSSLREYNENNASLAVGFTKPTRSSSIKNSTSDTTVTGTKDKNTLITDSKGTTDTDEAESSTSNTLKTDSEETINKSSNNIDLTKIVPKSTTTKDLSPITASVTGDIASDPMLRYLVATSLFQEMKVLNKYIKYASLKSGYKAHLIVLKVALMPKARSLPFDAYTNISFYTKKDTTQEGISTFFNKQTSDIKVKNPIVLPLVATDSIESIADSRTKEDLSKLAFAIMAAYQEIGAQADVSKISDTINSIIGQNFNSISTVAKLDDNTLRVRFGAMNQASKPAMVDRNYNIICAVLVPVGYNDEINVVTMSEFTNAVTGETLPYHYFSKIRDSIFDEIVESEKGRVSDVNPTFNLRDFTTWTAEAKLRYSQLPHDLDAMTVAVLRNDQDGFAANFKKYSLQKFEPLYDLVWEKMKIQYTQSPYKVTSFTPRDSVVSLPAVANANFYLVDDGEKMTTYFTCSKWNTVKNAHPTLKFSANEKQFALSPQAVIYEGENRIKIEFPSISKIDRLNKDSIYVELYNKTEQNQYGATYSAIKKADPKETEKVELISVAGFIVKDGKGVGNLDLKAVGTFPLDSYALLIKNAIINSTTPSDRIVKNADGDYIISKKGAVRIELANLDTSEAVEIKAISKDAGKSSNTLVLKVK